MFNGNEFYPGIGMCLWMSNLFNDLFSYILYISLHMKIKHVFTSWEVNGWSCFNRNVSWNYSI
jgi:hypothetical protein